MNPFKAYDGIHLNGIFYHKKDLLKASMVETHPVHLREVFAFAAKIFDKSKTIKVSTSGSTGKPKKLEFPKIALVTSAQATNKYFELQKESRALLALPMRYIAGKMMVVRAIVGRYSLDVIEPTSVPISIHQKVDYDFVPMTPYQAAQCLEAHPKLLSKVGAVLIGGGLVSDELRRGLALAKVNAYASFGMTETLSHFALAHFAEGHGDVTYELLKGVEIKIRKNGLLRVKWKEVTRGWLDTNDIVAPAEKGFTWLGRGDHLINSGGIKVIPELVEKRLAHLVNLPYFVAGIPHEKLGEEVALFIEAEGLPANDLLRDVQDALSDTAFWQPRRLIATVPFMYTPTGKIMRGETVKRFLESEKKQKPSGKKAK